jgi:type I site-specific restriction-modification system R (restriction) subunit
MIAEDQLEQLAIQWFQDTGWNHIHGAVIAPEGVAAEREDFRAVVLKGRLAEAVRRLNPKLPESAVEEVIEDEEDLSARGSTKGKWAELADDWTGRGRKN